MRALKIQLSPGWRSCQTRFLWQLTQEREDDNDHDDDDGDEDDEEDDDNDDNDDDDDDFETPRATQTANHTTPQGDRGTESRPNPPRTTPRRRTESRPKSRATPHRAKEGGGGGEPRSYIPSASRYG